MMHPSRQAYVEEDTDMGVNFADLRKSRQLLPKDPANQFVIYSGRPRL